MRTQGGLLDGNEPLRMTEFFKFAASVTLPCQIFVLPKDPDAAADALRRSLIVSGDTHYTDACGLAAGHGIAYFRTRRVEHTDQRDESEVALEARIVFCALGMVVANINVLDIDEC